MNSLLESHSRAIEELCRAHHVSRLELFGSAVTDRFDPEVSDADFLVEFHADALDLFDDYFGLQEGLERLLGRPVDLVMRDAVSNPYFAQRAFAQAQLVFRAA